VRLRGGRSVALAVALALVLNACSGGDDDDAAPGGTAHHVEETTADAVDGGSLIVGLAGEPPGLDPTASTLDPTAMTYALALFDPLMAMTDDGAVVPYLAESIDANDDHTVWTLQLRPGVTFSDGSPVNGAAVARAFEARLGSPVWHSTLRAVESVRALGELTVQLQMKQPWVAFPTYLTGQLGLVPAPSMLDDPQGARTPVGSGPFVLESWAVGDRMQLTRNPTYWQPGLPHLDQLTLRAIPDPARRAAALAGGDVDVIVADEPSAVDAIGAIEDVALADVPAKDGPGYEIVFNTSAPPFDDVECRRVVANAVDHEGADSPEPDGCDDLSFTYRTGDSEIDHAVAEDVEAQLDDAGVDVNVVSSDAGSAELDGLFGHFEAIGRVRPPVVDPDQRFASLDENNVGPVDTLAVNIGRYVDDDLQEAFEAARAEDDADDRAARYDDIDELLTQSIPILSLGGRATRYAFDADVGGVRRGITAPGGDTIVPLPGALVVAALHRTDG
jgi:ABC-type transport system substrate-binding protein